MTQKVRVMSGTGKWAYWISPVTREVVADDICRPEAGHFAGMFLQVVTEPGEYEMRTDTFIPERPGCVFAGEEE